MTQVTIENPILKGFNPDPSILRVEDDYYIATSTFEWFPGVQIHHSRDLRNWRLLTRPLDRVSQLDLRGVPDSGGIWAPCLSWSNGTFYLIYTVVHHLNGSSKDTPNYLVTAPDIMGPWSEPIHLNSSGFDPSLFHDDGKMWLMNMIHDHRPDKYPFYGIALQEYDHEAKTLVGEQRLIFKGTKHGCTEGPHLYKRHGYYYLILAEGGTSWEHCVTLARSSSIEGPYEVHPKNPILTALGDENLPLQKTGHADLVETQNGEWYMVHLCSRPIGDHRRCILGRETAIQRVEWRDDDWLYLASDGNRPKSTVPAPDLPELAWEPTPDRDEFECDTLPVHFQSLRIPHDEETLSLKERTGYLRLRGGESLASRFGTVLVARRQQSACYQTTTKLEFRPTTFQQMAGLVCFYSTKLYHYLYMSTDEHAGTCLRLETCDDGKCSSPLREAVIPLSTSEEVYLRAEVRHDKLKFFYSLNGKKWHQICGELDASILSDDYGVDWGFTGAFVGLTCQDLSGQRLHADFDFLEYRELAD